MTWWESFTFWEAPTTCRPAWHPLHLFTLPPLLSMLLTDPPPPPPRRARPAFPVLVLLLINTLKQKGVAFTGTWPMSSTLLTWRSGLRGLREDRNQVEQNPGDLARRSS